MIGGRPVAVRLLLPQLQPSRWKHLMQEPRSHFLQLQKTLCQKSDKNCGPPKPNDKPKEGNKPSACISYKKDPCDESSEAPKMEKDAKAMPSNTRLDRRRKYLAEMQKKKAKKEPSEEPNHCAKPKEEKASKDSCGKTESKASKESACGQTKPKPKASKENSCSKASKEDSCGNGKKEKSSKKDPCAVYTKFLDDGKGKKGKKAQEPTCGKSVPKKSQAPTCETAVGKMAALQQQQNQQPKSQIAKGAPSANEIRQPVDWNAMESLLSCMISGVKVACVTHEERKIFDKLAAARDRRLDDEEASQNIKCAAGAAKNVPPDGDLRAEKWSETEKKGKDSPNHEE